MMELPKYRYGGARALVEMHDRALREFLATWRRAEAQGLVLPTTEDPSYASRSALLHHVLRCARGYMTWMCEVLRLQDPGIDEAPAVERIAREADAYVAHVLERWRTPLADVSEEACYRPEHPSRWNTRYCIDAMLEHAVMHPRRHAHQLERLMAGR